MLPWSLRSRPGLCRELGEHRWAALPPGRGCLVHRYSGSATPGDPGGSSARLEAASEPGESILHGEHTAQPSGTVPREKNLGNGEEASTAAPWGKGYIASRGVPSASGQADLCCIHLEQSHVGGIGQLTGFSIGTVRAAWFFAPMSHRPKGHLLQPQPSPGPAAGIRAALR